MKSFRPQPSYKKPSSIVTLFLIVTMTLSGVFLTPHKTHAIDDVWEFELAGFIEENIQTGLALEDIGMQAASLAYKAKDFILQTGLFQKEWTWDGVAFALINTMIQQMSKSIIQWINSGFQGSPAFVTNLGAFLLDVADVTAGKFLTELGLGSMCTPFKFNIQLALAYQYQAGRTGKYSPECRISQVVGNMENFFNGDIVNNGGWGSWLTMTTIPSNNPYGALAEATAKMELSINNAKGQQIKLLDFGRGFRSLMNFEDPACSGEGDCGITTPGAVIESQLNNVLDSGRQRLVIADEINEIISALFAQLVQQAFTGVGGLLGLTSKGFTPSGFSYVEATANSVTTPTMTAGGGIAGASGGRFGEALTNEKAWQAVQQDIVDRIDALDAYETTRCGTDSCTTMPAHLENLRTAAKAEVEATKARIVTLTSMETRYLAATNNDEKLVVINELDALGTLHNSVDADVARIQVIGNQYRGLVADANTYRTQIDQAADERNRSNSSDSDSRGD